MTNLAAGILGFFVTVIGSAIVGGVLVLLAIIVALHLYEWGQAVWRRVAKACDPLGWWPK